MLFWKLYFVKQQPEIDEYVLRSPTYHGSSTHLDMYNSQRVFDIYDQQVKEYEKIANLKVCILVWGSFRGWCCFFLLKCVKDF